MILNELLPDSSVGECFVLPRMEVWIQGQQARVLKEFCFEIGLTPIRYIRLAGVDERGITEVLRFSTEDSLSP